MVGSSNAVCKLRLSDDIPSTSWCYDTTPNATWSAHVAQSIYIVLLMPSSSIVRVCGWMAITRNDPTVQESSSLNAALDITLVEFVAAVECICWTTETMSPGANIGLSWTHFS